LDRRPDMGGLFVPLQPDHFSTYTGSSVAGGRSAVAPPGQAVQSSFYDTAAGQPTNAASQRNPFSGDTSSGGGTPAGGSTNVAKDRKGSGVEFWPR
jgi:dual specificity protein kinase YAK1